ncbi:hypothetical protein ACNF49_52995 [Actinomadura sp. ATCC 39365]
MSATQLSAVGTPRCSSSQMADPAAVTTRSAAAISSGRRSVGGMTVMPSPASNGSGLTSVAWNGTPVQASASAQAGATPALSVPPKKQSTRGTGPGSRTLRRPRTLSRSSAYRVPASRQESRGSGKGRSSAPRFWSR